MRKGEVTWAASILRRKMPLSLTWFSVFTLFFGWYSIFRLHIISIVMCSILHPTRKPSNPTALFSKLFCLMTTKVSSPWGAFLGLAWSGKENVWEDGSAWDYQNFGQGHIRTSDFEDLIITQHNKSLVHRYHWVSELLQVWVQPRRQLEQRCCREVLWHQEPTHRLLL